MASSLIGKQAAVIGAGMGGLTAAGALADRFDQMVGDIERNQQAGARTRMTAKPMRISVAARSTFGAEAKVNATGLSFQRNRSGRASVGSQPDQPLLSKIVGGMTGSGHSHRRRRGMDQDRPLLANGLAMIFTDVRVDPAGSVSAAWPGGGRLDPKPTREAGYCGAASIGLTLERASLDRELEASWIECRYFAHANPAK
jgi:hypothetical protein